MNKLLISITVRDMLNFVDLGTRGLVLVRRKRVKPFLLFPIDFRLLTLFPPREIRPTRALVRPRVRGL